LQFVGKHSKFMTTKLLANQLRSILNDPVEGYTVELADESNLYEWKVYMEGPKETCYEGGVFQLSLSFPKDYPMYPPVLKFISDFWHPNVFADGKVCMSILHPPGEDVMSGELPEERWLPTQSVNTIILSLFSVLNDPNCASPANVDASVEWRKHRESFKSRCIKLAEKANRERPAHIVIPHPESDADQRSRRVQKFHEMNKELDFEDFYENDGYVEEEGEGNSESGDENEDEFLESENEMNTDDESAKSPSQETTTTQNEISEDNNVKKEKDDAASDGAEVEVKKAAESKKDKGKAKIEEKEKEKDKAKEIKENNDINNLKIDNSSDINVAPPSSSSSHQPAQTNNSSDPVIAKKKGKKSRKNGGKKKGDKCLVM